MPAGGCTPAGRQWTTAEPTVPYRLLAFDYDETAATEGAIPPVAEEAFIEARRAGWRLALVTGRPHEELLAICRQVPLFDLVVDENGGVIHLPEFGVLQEIADRPDRRLREGLVRRSVPFISGRIVTITRRPYEAEARAVIDEHGLAMEMFCNRHAIMIVPRGTDKASGLKEGLTHLGLEPHEIIAVGDDANDLALLRLAGLRVAVANAIDAVKAEAHMVLARPNGEGLAEFIRERLLGPPGALPEVH